MERSQVQRPLDWRFARGLGRTGCLDDLPRPPRDPGNLYRGIYVALKEKIADGLNKSLVWRAWVGMERVRNFDEWYRREFKTVLAAAVVAASGDRAVAEDAVAEAFVAAFRRWDSVSVMESATAWTVTVATNRVRRAQRSLFRRRAREQRHSAANPNTTSDEHAPVDSNLWDAVNRLTHKQRQALVLRYVEGATQAETADEMGIAAGTAAATLHQARARLHEELTREVGET